MPHPTRLLRWLLPLAGLLLLVLSRDHAAASGPVTIAVTTTQDELNADGDCALREAVRAANLNLPVDRCPAGSATHPDTITLPAGTYRLQLPGQHEDDGATGDLDITGKLELRGADKDVTILDGNHLDRVVDVHPEAIVLIREVTIRYGKLIDMDPISWDDGYEGAGIANHHGTVTVTNSLIHSNQATQGGGISQIDGVLTLQSSSLLSNTAYSAVGAVVV